ncbi:glycosyltransferase family 29 protein [bacterium]|nr:glycosyltransferase family 29 protein [bacterium]
MKYCLVGNSSNLLSKNLGQKIDSFDSVIRFNRSPIKGFESYVGSKTTYRFINRVVCNGGKEQPSEDVTIDSRYDNQHFILDLENPNFSKEKFSSTFPSALSYAFLSRPEELANLYDKFNFLPFFTRSNPTVGFTMICYCLNRELDFTICGYGIDQDPSSSPHYWEEKNYKSSHDYKCERDIISLLVDKKYIKLL